MRATFAILILGASLLFCGCKKEDEVAKEGAPPVTQTAKGGMGMAQTAPEMMPPAGAPTADDVVGSKTGG